MDAALKLDIAVGLLLRRSKHLMPGPDGKPQLVEAEPLLVQLALAVGSDIAASGQGGASTGSPILIAAAALDLQRAIESEAADLYWEHGGTRRDSRLGERVRCVAAAAQANADALKKVERKVSGWVASIQNLFNPHRRKPLPGECPNKKCKATQVFDREEFGETYRKPALSKVYDDEGRLDRIECGACEMSWTAVEVEVLFS